MLILPKITIVSDLKEAVEFITSSEFYNIKTLIFSDSEVISKFNEVFEECSVDNALYFQESIMRNTLLDNVPRLLRENPNQIDTVIFGKYTLLPVLDSLDSLSSVFCSPTNRVFEPEKFVNYSLKSLAFDHTDLLLQSNESATNEAERVHRQLQSTIPNFYDVRRDGTVTKL